MVYMDDCKSCRVANGLGLIAGGFYTIHFRPRKPILGSWIVQGIGIGICILGACRGLDLPPFGKKEKGETTQSVSQPPVDKKRLYREFIDDYIKSKQGLTYPQEEISKAIPENTS